MASVGPYELHEPIGEGGMAQVFRATRVDGGDVAIKVLHGGGDASAEQLARFEREIRIAERIEHPHLIRVIDHGVDEALGPWLAMPLVRGMTLRDLFGRRALGPEAALVLLAPLADALAALHAEGLVHRDVKPENLMVSPLGDVTLVDLGLALAETDTRHTREGEVAGSVPYMSPERIEGRDVAPSADVWAFGVMLYELVTGRRPFERARAGEEVAAILSGTFAPLSGVDRRVPEELDALLAACLDADPAARPRDGAALLERLLVWMSGTASEARALRVSVITDAAAFAAKAGARVTEQLRREARTLIDSGRPLDAIRKLDRALAYAPDDAETLALVERASSGETHAAVASEPASRPRPRWPWAAAGLVGLAIAGGAVTIIARDADTTSSDASLETSAHAPRDAGVTDAAREDGGADDAGVRPLVYHPIPPDVLSNDDPADPSGVAAAPGEPLVETEAVGGDPNVVLATATRRLEDEPSDVEALVERMFALFVLGRTDEGFVAARSLENTHSDSPRALTALGFLALRQGRFDDADELLTRAIDIDPRYRDALRHRGVLRSRRGQTRDAYLDLARVLDDVPDNLYALAEMTEVYVLAHRTLDAVPVLRRLVERFPRYATAGVSRGSA
ncbi:MAG: protein kinase, partial [Sandaracinaceae bacterium]